jgi:hypothetical protein
MKKSSILLGLLALTATTVEAQITITQADFPLSVVNYTSLSDSSSGMSGINPGNAGINQTWNFSTFTTGNTQSFTVDYNANNPNPDYPSANVSLCGALSVFQSCSYQELNSNGLFLYGGIIETPLGSPMMMRQQTHYTPAEPSYLFPFTFGSIDSISFFVHQLNTFNPPQGNNDSSIIHYHRTKKIEADGWGTLITPFGTYNALRIKTTRTNVDTTFAHTPGSGWSTETITPFFTEISYEWVSNVEGAVLANIRDGSQSGNWRYTFYDRGGNISPQAPAAPTNLTATTNKRSNGSIELNWQDNANNEDGFYVEFSQDTTSSSWTLLATLGVDEETYIHTGLNDGEQFFYRVSAFNAVGSSAFSNVAETTVSVNSFHDFFENNISIYPNPVKNHLFINANQNNGNLLAEIFDLTGKRIKEVNIINNLEKIDVSEFDNGMYYLKINANEGVKVLKFIKN